MKLKRIFTAFLLICLCCMVSCEGEKELIHLGNDIPTKLGALYMVGNASPDNWDIDYPTQLVQSDEDPYIWIYNGALIEGEFKLCIKTGTWEQPMFHSMTSNEEIGKEPVVDKPFQAARQGGEDEKWLVVTPGVYKLSFNLRTRTYCSVYEGEIGSDVTPIETDGVYLYGGAAPTGTNLAGAEPMEVSGTDKYIFTWTGDLYVGTLRFAVSTTDESLPMIRPLVNNENIGRSNIENGSFVYRVRPDANWYVSDNGNYTITLNLREWTISTVFNHEVAPKPIETGVLYICGEPVKGETQNDDWFMLMEQSAVDEYVFTWKGRLNSGSGFWFMIDIDDWERMIQPIDKHTYISKDESIVDQAFSYPKCPGNYNWFVNKSDVYEIEVDLRNYTFSIEWKGDSSLPEPIETDVLYICGNPVKENDSDAIYWQEMTRSYSNEYIFTWKGNLRATSGDGAGIYFMIDYNDWDRMLRPVDAHTFVSKDEPADNQPFSYPTGGNYNWYVTESDIYEVTVDLEYHTVSIVWTGEEPELEPIEADKLLICGEAVKAETQNDDWYMEMTVSTENPYIFTWQGHLTAGKNFWLMMDPDDWNRMIQPVDKHTYIFKEVPIVNQIFSYPNCPGNYNWFASEYGVYEITADLQKHTLSARYVSE